MTLSPRARSVLGLLGLSVLALVILYPVAILVFTAFKTGPDLIANPTGLPTNWTFANLAKAWDQARMGTLMINSLIVSGGVVLGTVALSSIGGFAFGRLEFRGRRWLPILLTIGLVLPFEVLMVPIFYTFRDLGLLNSYLAMILPQVALGLPFGILLIRGFIVDLPSELFDAAEIDGAGLWHQYRYIAMPLAKSALVALGVLELLWSWNQYLVALVMVQTTSLRTIPLGLSLFVGRYQTDYVTLAAAALIALVPSLVLYIVFHRHVLRANLSGALK
jgi:ABC-type glycerol-3-phosphate transport system permease component